jgi:microcystin-dependent protein
MNALYKNKMASINFCESFTFDATINSTLSKNVIVNSGSTFTITGNLNTNFTESTIYLPTSDKILVGSSTLATNINNGSVPRGVIMMWSGTTIPDGWALCNGQTVSGMITPNLQGRFVIGTNTSYPINLSGGNATYTLTAANIPTHSHTASGTNNVSHTHNIGARNGDDDNNDGNNTTGWAPDTGSPFIEGTSGNPNSGFVNHTHTYTTAYENGTAIARTSVTPISLLPRYYVLSYIMKL